MGLLRANVDLSMQLYAFTATVTGFYLTEPLLADEDQVSLETKARALAQTVQDAFEPATPLLLDALREEVAPRIILLLEQICDFCEQQMRERMA